MIQDKIFFDEKDPTGLSYNTPFTFYGSYQGRLWSKSPSGSIQYYTQNSDLSVYATTGSNSFDGNQVITGSLTVTEGITGTATTASYIEYANIDGKPALVSSSAQVLEYNIFATTGSNGFNGDQAITGSLTTTGTIVAQTLNVQQVTSSIVYSSGSNIFGNDVSNTQQFTGSLQVSGSSHYLLGNVGVGITPNAGIKLDVGFTSDNRSIARLSSNAANRMVGVTFYGNSAESATIGYEGGSEILSGGQQGDFIIRNVLANKNIILATNNSGNIGINTTSPNPGGSVSGTTVLTISPQIGVSERWGILELAGNRTSGGNQVGEIKFTNINTTNTVVASITALNTATAVTGGSLSFSTKTDAGALTERLNIASTGAATFTNSTSGNALRLYTSYASGRALNFGFSDGSVLPTAAFYVGNQTGVGVFIGDETTTNGLYVKSNGDVGIGFTTVTNKLQVAGEITTHAGTNTQYYAYINYLGTTYNFGPGETADNVDFKIAGGGTFTSGGNFRFFTQAGGATPIERMRITPGGAFKAKGTESTYHNLNASYHELRTGAGGQFAAAISNTAGLPFGLLIDFNSAPNSSSYEFLYCTDGIVSTLRAAIRSNGGLSNFQANDTNLSDERIKKDIIPLESYWDKFKAIEIVKFKYKDQTHDDFNIGVIAQQVEAVAPEFVDVDGWDTKPELDEEGNEIVSTEEPLKSIYTADLHHATIKVLQEAMAKIETLEAKIQTLEQQ